MPENLFRGLFDASNAQVVSVTDFLLCVGSALVIGLLLALMYMHRTRYTKSFVATLALLPAVVCVVIMMVNGNVGTGVAVAGTFSLVRFRSVPGTAKEIGAIFLAMGAGLVCGMGYLAYGFLFALVLSGASLLYSHFDFGARKRGNLYKTLHITIPEDLDYTGVFDGILEKYASSWEVVQVKTTVSTKGLKATASLVLNGGTFNLDCADDGLHSNGDLTVNGGSYQIATGDDGMHADGALTISEGDVEITQSYEGIEGLSIDITGGDISLVASDDGLNAAGGADGSGTGNRMDQFKSTEGAYISISGGTLRVDASGDGIDSNGDLYVTGGEIYVSGPTNGGNSTLDYTGEGVISGGVFCGTGSLGMAQNFGTSSTQGVMMVSVDTQAAGTTIRLLDGDGQELGSWQADKEYSSVIVSCPEITQGATYTLEAGDTTTEVVMDSLVYGAGGMGGPRGGAGAGGGRGGMRNPDGQGLGAAQGVPEAQKGAFANPTAGSEAGN